MVVRAFIMEKDFPGFSTGKHEKKMGIPAALPATQSSQRSRRPKENLLGKERLKIAEHLDGGRIGIAPCLGLAEGAISPRLSSTPRSVSSLVAA